jgi:hypothetical protein
MTVFQEREHVRDSACIRESQPINPQGKLISFSLLK